ncbi:MAG TPA: hypothetical protein VFN74_10160 [Chloroflexota bacterium]|nr:hypothetical protein [Chloroflexota bacterium]
MAENALERAQERAAELVLEDEAWRDGLEDEQAKGLLDEALALLDEALAQHAAEGALNEELPYLLADEARAMLREKSAALLGGGAA